MTWMICGVQAMLLLDQMWAAECPGVSPSQQDPGSHQCACVDFDLGAHTNALQLCFLDWARHLQASMSCPPCPGAEKLLPGPAFLPFAFGTG